MEVLVQVSHSSDLRYERNCRIFKINDHRNRQWMRRGICRWKQPRGMLIYQQDRPAAQAHAQSLAKARPEAAPATLEMSRQLTSATQAQTQAQPLP